MSALESTKRGDGSAEPRAEPRAGASSSPQPARPRAVFALLASCVLLSSLSCTPKKQPPSAGASPSRIVSISPSTTETLFAIGAGDRVVGRSRYCDYPPEVAKLPQIGGFVDPSFEAVLGLRPDLVTGARGPSGTMMTERLEARSIPTYFPPTETFAQIDAMILGLGERTGNAAQAKAVVAKLDARIAGIEKALAGKPKRRVLLVFGLEPVSVAGPNSFADEMVTRAGGTNVVAEGGAYPTIGVERVIALDPDVVLNAAMAESKGHERIGKDTPGWAKVRAVSEGRVVRIEDESVLRPGPRIAEGLAVLARAIHPEIPIPEAVP
ncbi:MAG: ABC transporter substrate-binding protein [Deltaproteobacteria bacterium]|nr:ABC transporter substrate-binding protein [Deltaproteobacteria bacterium]